MSRSCNEQRPSCTRCGLDQLLQEEMLFLCNASFFFIQPMIILRIQDNNGIPVLSSSEGLFAFVADAERRVCKEIIADRIM